ncbi:MAG: hypothetical protein NVS3B16_27280 [Vulcanimicrobiaceae bacterium]
MNRIIAYFRVSTKRKASMVLAWRRNGLASQRASVAGYAQRLGVNLLLRTREVETARRDSFKKCS